MQIFAKMAQIRTKYDNVTNINNFVQYSFTKIRKIHINILRKVSEMDIVFVTLKCITNITRVIIYDDIGLTSVLGMFYSTARKD